MNLQAALSRRVQVEEFLRKHRLGLLTLLFTDIVGSTRLKQDLGDTQAVTLIQGHHSLVRETLSQFTEGEEIETAGDSFFLVFAKPSDAVKFSLLLQAKLRAFAQETRCAVPDRIGLHVGEVFVEEHEDTSKNLYGIQVDTTARVMALAQPNQILMSRFAFDNARQVLKGRDLQGIGPISWLNHGPYLMKGVEDPLEICEVGETGLAPLSPPPDSDKAHRHVSADGEPVLGWRPALAQVVPGSEWVLEKKLGEGGFGEVWLGQHQKLKARRVFKFCFRADRVRSLKREVTLFRVLKEHVGEHPNIVRVEDVYFEKPPFYVVMEYVEGKDLSSWRPKEGTPEARARATCLEIVAQVAEALQAAHEAGVIHRDVKPSNILVEDTGGTVRVKLTDFGIGQVVSEEALAGVTRLGFTRTVMTAGTSTQSGTQLYMAPELFAGKPASPRSDIYSLGVVLFQLLLGDFTRPVTTDWAKEISDPLLREDLEKCFAGNPQERFSSAGQLASQLRSWEKRQAALTEERAIQAARERAAYRRGIMRTVAVAGCIVVVVSALAIYALKQAAHATRKTHEATAARDRVAQEGQRARRAERAAKGELREAYLAQARMNRALASAGSRLQNLEVLRQAAQIRPGLDLRNEAVATLSLLDVKNVRPPLKLPYVRFDADLRHYATRDTNGNVTVRATLTDRDVLYFPSPGRRPAQVRFSPDNQFLAIHYEEVLGQKYTGDDLVRVWALQRCWPQWGTQESTAPAQAVAPPAHVQPLEIRYRNNNDLTEFTPDSQRLILGNQEGSLHFYDLHTGQRTKTIGVQPTTTSRLALSPTGGRFAEWNGYSVMVRDMADGREVTPPLHHPAGLHQVAAVAWHPNGKHLAVACSPQIHLWDVDAHVELTTIAGHRDEVLTVEFNHAGTLLASSSRDGTTRLWDPVLGKLVFTGLGSGFHLKFSRDDRWLSFSSIVDDTFVLWEMASNAVVRTLHKHELDLWPFRATGVSAGGYLVAQELQEEVKLWHLHSGREMASIPLRDNEQLWLGDKTGSLYLSGARGLTRWPVQPVTPSGEIRIGPPEMIDSGRTNSLVRTSSEGHRIATICRNHCHVFDADSRMELAQTGCHWGVAFAALSSDGQRLATINQKGVRIWQARTGRLERELPTDGASTILFSPDGRWLLTGTSAAYCLWDAASWTPHLRAVRATRPNALETMAFSPDARVLALTPTVSSVRLLDIASGQELVTLEAPDPWPISWLGFTPDGAQLVVAGGTRFIHVWDLRLLRQELAPMGLDWEQPPLAAAAAVPEVTRVLLRTGDPTPAPGRPIDLSQKIPPRDRQAGAHLIDLAPSYNAALAEEWHRPGWTNGFACVPLGVQKLDGVEFDLRGVIQLAGQQSNQSRTNSPEALRRLKVGRLCHRLHFLHSIGGKEADGGQIGSYVIHYVGGATRQVPIRYGEELRSWWVKDDPRSDLTHAKVAWTGTNTAGLTVQLCHSTWENPLPSLEIESLDFIGAMARAEPFLLALTAE